MIPIHLRNMPPPMETFNSPEFITYMAKWIKPECYLELGIRYGDAFHLISPYCKMAVGVDIDISQLHYPIQNNWMLIKKTTDEFFKDLESDNVFDMIFIDADHKSESVIKDFVNASKHIIDDGFIFLHDTYPCDKRMTEHYYSNDCYKAALEIKTRFNDEFEIVTLPFNPGLTIIKKMKHNKQLTWL